MPDRMVARQRTSLESEKFGNVQTSHCAGACCARNRVRLVSNCPATAENKRRYAHLQDGASIGLIFESRQRMTCRFAPSSPQPPSEELSMQTVTIIAEATFVPATARRRTLASLGLGSRNRAVAPVTMSLQELQSTRKQSLTIVSSVAQRLILLAGRTGCRHCSRASSARAGSSVSIRRRHCAHRPRRNCRHGG